MPTRTDRLIHSLLFVLLAGIGPGGALGADALAASGAGKPRDESPATTGANEPGKTELRAIDARCFGSDERDRAGSMLERFLDARLVDAARRETAAWERVRTREDWRRFRDARLEALRASLGTAIASVPKPKSLSAATIEGDGFAIENLAYESRDGVWVPANLWRPVGRTKPAPAIIAVHSHHRPREEGELQDLGVSAARLGVAVLVPELPGHGERREHPFVGEGDWTGDFRPSRQDYYFRQPLSLELALAGESLMGWMVRDIVRAVDLLVARDDIDPARIALLGAVAGGGDPAGVAAALDTRIATVAPFNFGGPQPDYPIPDDSDDFYWFGVPYWESTRALRLGARDGFAHWVIAGSVAPRGLIYSYEFDWPRERDPVWPRLERVFSLEGHTERLRSAEGRGSLAGTPPESTHCTNIGPAHRAALWPSLEHWLDVPALVESRARRAPEELRVLSSAVVQGELRSAREVAREVAAAHVAAARRTLAELDGAARRARLAGRWRELLGLAENATPRARVLSSKLDENPSSVTVERTVLETEPGIRVPILSLRSIATPVPRAHAIAVAREGKARILDELAPGVSVLIRRGVEVSLADLRGTGETAPGGDIGPFGEATTLSATAGLLGRSLLGDRIRDLQAVIAHVRSRDIERSGARRPIVLFGFSFAPVNRSGQPTTTPLRTDDRPALGDPGAALAVLLTALFDEEVTAVHADGLVASWLGAFDSPCLWLPHDTVVSGATTAGDIADIVAALAPRDVRIRGLIDLLDRRLERDAAAELLAPLEAAFVAADAELDAHSKPRSDGAEDEADWAIERVEQIAGGGER